MYSVDKVFWDVTNQCNAQCIHCFTNSGSKEFGELSTLQMYSVIEQLAEIGVKSIAFSGGEPFVRSDILDVLSFTKIKNISVSLTTNGSLLTKEIIDRISRLNIKSITISFDAYKKETFNRIRKGLDFDVVKSNIRSLVALGSCIEVNCRTTLNIFNIDEVDSIFDFCDDIGVHCLKVNNTNKWGRAKGIDIKIDENTFIDKLFMLKQKAYLKKCGLELPIEKYIQNSNREKDNNICTSTIKTINIFPNGDLGPCGFCERQLVFGNVKKEQISTMFERELPFDFNNSICNVCKIHQYKQLL
jgi:MoaA/NifB/PqqE/SkfB family radical SAM enzyme